MRKKYTDETYLKGVSRYKVAISKIKDEESYVVVKNILEIDKPFIKNAKLIDNGYYILEYTSMNKLYNARAFIDDKLNTISYYFDISLGNGIDEGRPYYDDLFLDIIYGINIENDMKILDEDELQEALEKEVITKEEFDLAYSVCNKLLEEIKENKNHFINMNKKEIIKKCKWKSFIK